MIKLHYTIILIIFLASCKSGGSIHFDNEVDTIEIYTDLTTFSTPYSLECEITNNTTVKKGYKFILTEKEIIQKVIEQINELEQNDGSTVWTSSLIVLVKNKNNINIQLCTASNFAGGYLMNGEKYDPNEDLNFALARILLDKFNNNLFSCMDDIDCDKRKEELKLIDEEYGSISNIFMDVINQK